jgi:hypothetical protein
MKKNKYAALVILSSVLFFGCKYDDYIHDFDYSTVYFAYQGPVRTVYSDNPKIEIGVALGGKIESNKDEIVKFRVANELLTDPAIMGSSKFTLLPSNYYTLSNENTMIIHKGEYIGTVTLTLNDKFLSDPLSISNTYAIPLKITESTTDSILVANADKGVQGKDYTIVVIKYINPYSGVYYHRGIRKGFNSSGRPIDTLQYVKPSEELIYMKDLVWNFKTVDVTTIKCDGVAEFLTTSTKNYSLNLKIAADNSVTIKNDAASLISNIVDKGGSAYDKTNKKFYLNYEYTDATSSNKYVMSDTLIYRNSGLVLELWK